MPHSEGFSPITDRNELRLPGALAADIDGALAVSDTGNHRILYGHLVGNVFQIRKVIGTGEPGLRDGTFDIAEFREPRGLALSGDLLIVADQGNHAIRMVDLASGEVGTMAGTGEPGEGRDAGGDPLDTPLPFSSDVLLQHYDLFIAVAGPQPIRRLDLKERTLVPHLPRAASEIADRALDPDSARPIALTTDGETLYFADAGSSTVRRVPFAPGGEVETLVGEPLDSGDEATDGGGRLRHPAGLAWGQGNHRLWIADTGHHLLKTLEPRDRRLETVEPFEAELEEPMGLASAGHLLFLADTNHHRILRVDQIDKRVTELQIEGA